MLQNDFVPQLLATELPVDTQKCMQDGAVPHTANVVLDFLTVFGDCVMSFATKSAIMDFLTTLKPRFKSLQLLFVGLSERGTLHFKTCKCYGSGCAYC
jgi:hypothetical protein